MRLSRRAVLLALSVLVASSAVACKKHETGSTTTTTRFSGPKTGMQLRAMTGQAPDCGPMPQNPPADQPLAVLYQTQCVSLAPAGLVVTTADVAPSVNPNDNAPVVLITLKGDDVKKMASFSQANVNKQVAVLAFGKVLTLALFAAVVTDGKFQITNVGRNDALRLRASLS